MGHGLADERERERTVIVYTQGGMLVIIVDMTRKIHSHDSRSTEL